MLLCSDFISSTVVCVCVCVCVCLPVCLVSLSRSLSLCVCVCVRPFLPLSLSLSLCDAVGVPGKCAGEHSRILVRLPPSLFFPVCSSLFLPAARSWGSAHALYVCLVCTPYMHALYVCLIYVCRRSSKEKEIRAIVVQELAKSARASSPTESPETSGVSPAAECAQGGSHGSQSHAQRAAGDHRRRTPPPPTLERGTLV